MKPAKYFLMIFILALLLAACNPATPTAEVTSVPTVPPTAPVPPTDTPAPSPTPLPARALLVGDPVDAALAAAVQELAAGSGLAFETRSTFSIAEISPDVKIVIYSSVPEEMAALNLGAPGTQFVVLADQDLPTAANVSLIRSRPEYALFTAGYISTLIAPDWRAGALLTDGGAQDVFINGGRYWCGRCAPTYGPVVLFPLTATQPAGSPATAWQAAFDGIHQSRIEVLYLAPEAASAELFASLPPELILLGGATPSPLPANWAVTLGGDVITPLQTLWPDLLTGKGGQTLNSSLTLYDVNPELLSPGRQARVQEVIQLLAEGLINPLSVP